MKVAKIRVIRISNNSPVRAECKDTEPRIQAARDVWQDGKVWDSRSLPVKRLAISASHDIEFVRKLIGI